MDIVASRETAGGFLPAPKDRFVVVRPRGGLNDSLVQLERARRYAIAYGRTLAVDFSRSGIRLPFGTLFRVRQGFGCPVIEADSTLLAALDAAGSVEPALLEGVLASYETEWDPALAAYVYGAERRVVTFDMTVDHAARCLVHEQCGGGRIGALPLRGLALAPDIAADILQRLAELGDDYDALHVRHTDYRTDYKRLFARVKPLFLGRRLLVCTDSAEVQRYARAFFAPEIEVLTNGDVPDLGGEPLHAQVPENPYAYALSQFCDLIAMARARRFFFFPLDRSVVREQEKFSGFSLLVEGLRTLPDVTDGLLSLAPELDRPQPVTAAPALPFPSRLRRLTAGASEFIWNNAAHRRRSRMRRLLATEVSASG